MTQPPAPAETAKLPLDPQGTEPAALAAGQRLGRYVLLDELGRGGMGQVWRVRDTELDRELALKVMRAGELAGRDEIARFWREARSVARLHHPHIVALHELGVEAGIHYFTMDIVEGQTLDAALAAGPLSWERAVQIALPLAEAVHYAHLNDVLHRDLKPGNVLLTTSGEPRLTDFGLARLGGVESRQLTMSGMVIGTPDYMSPEQARGEASEIDERSDVYSLGALLFEMLAGQPPFTGEDALDVLHQVAHGDPPAPPSSHRKGIPRDLEAICLKAMDRDPAARYPTAEALARDLARWSAGAETQARPLPLTGRIRRFVGRHRLACAIAAAVLAINVFYMAWLHLTLDRAVRAEAAGRRLTHDLRTRVDELERRDRQRGAVDLARQAARKGSPRQAAALFAQAVAQAPEPFEILWIQADYHWTNGRDDQARLLLQKSVEMGLAAEAPSARLGLVLLDQYWLTLQRDPRRMVDPAGPLVQPILRQLAALEPPTRAVRFARAVLAPADERLALLDAVIGESEVVFWQALAVRGLLHSQAGESDAALADLRAAIDAAPQQSALWVYSGWLNLMRMRPADALPDFQSAIEHQRRRGKPPGHLQAGRMFAATLTGQDDIAEQDLLALLRATRPSPDAADFSRLLDIPGLTLGGGAVEGFAAIILSAHIAKRPDRGYLRALRGILFLTLARNKGTSKARRQYARSAINDIKEAGKLDPRFVRPLARHLEGAENLR